MSAVPSPVDGSAAAFLGTIGGGNHFAEVSLVESVTDPETAQQLGISKGTIACLAHSVGNARQQEILRLVREAAGGINAHLAKVEL